MLKCSVFQEVCSVCLTADWLEIVEDRRRTPMTTEAWARARDRGTTREDPILSGCKYCRREDMLKACFNEQVVHTSIYNFISLTKIG